jgi:hypothetical protein
MKRNGDITSLFQKYSSKKAVVSSSPAATMVEDEPQVQERVTEEIMNPIPSSPPSIPTDDVSTQPTPVYDINRLPHDPGERMSIQSYPINDQDAIRRLYILKGPFQPYAHEFPKRKIGKRYRQFNFVWFHKHHWLEYSIKKDSVFCFICYLFKDDKCKSKGADAFVIDGWRNWNIGEKALLKHVGSSAHNAAQERYSGFVNPEATIDLEKR